MSLDEHKNQISVLTFKAVPSQSSEPSNLPAHTRSVSGKDRGKVRQASPIPFDSSDDEPLSDSGGKPPESKNWRQDPTTVELMIVDEDNDRAIPDKPKGSGKKP